MIWEHHFTSDSIPTNRACVQAAIASTLIWYPLIQSMVIKWKHFPRYWPFVWGIHRSPVNSPHKGQWRGALMFSLICTWINGWVNNREAGDLRHRAHYDITIMIWGHGPCRWILHTSGRHVNSIDFKIMIGFLYYTPHNSHRATVPIVITDKLSV